MKLDNEWVATSLGDIVQSVSEKHLLNQDEIVLINTSDVLEGNVINHEKVPNQNLKGQFKKRFRKNDILYSEIRPKNKRYAYVDFDSEDYVASTKLMVLRAIDSKVDSKFLYQILKSDEVINKLQMIAESRSGTFPQITFSELARLSVALPNLVEQKAIEATLSCLDDKIELNNHINKNLEEMAQAIFKSWFIDFEPFQDGEFEDSELGSLPKGWRVGTIGELISDTLGGDWGKETSEGNYTEEVICIRGADIPEIASGKKGKPPTRYILKKNLEKKRLSEGEIIIEISGGSPTQSTGRTALITHELVSMSGNPLICTNFCRAISLKEEEYSTFVYSMLQYLYSKDVFFLYENGTTGIKNLDINNLFNKHQIVIPDNETMHKYKEIFYTIIKSIYNNGAQSDKLSTIRDTLLPKLMSGEIRVPLEVE
jgi:type I restriction enzyme S subunit